MTEGTQFEDSFDFDIEINTPVPTNEHELSTLIMSLILTKSISELQALSIITNNWNIPNKILRSMLSDSIKASIQSDAIKQSMIKSDKFKIHKKYF